jgi:hypothetical protein
MDVVATATTHGDMRSSKAPEGWQALTPIAKARSVDDIDLSLPCQSACPAKRPRPGL